MSTSIDWTELIKDRKGVVTKDNQACGNIIGEDEENIIIEQGAINAHIYRVPKSTVAGYNGAELTLNIHYNELETYEEKEEDKDEGKEGSITESIKNKVTSLKEKTVDKVTEVKEKTVDKVTDTNDKDEYKNERSSDIGHADNVKYQSAGEIIGQDESRARSSYAQTSANTDTGKMSDETSANIDTSFTCETCDTKFTSRQELKEHSAAEH
jgi:hypothetical protein